MSEVREGKPEALGRRSARLRAWIAVAAVACGLTATRGMAETPADPARFGLPRAAQENVGGRTETSKEFALPDGSSARLLFTRPMHYQDDSGQWQDVDLSFHGDGEDGQIMDRHPNLRVRVPGRSGALEVTDTAGNGIRWLTSPAMSVHGRHAQYERMRRESPERTRQPLPA